MTPEDIDSLKAALPDRVALESLMDATDFEKQDASVQDQIILASQEIWTVLDYVDELIFGLETTIDKMNAIMEKYEADPRVQYQREPRTEGQPRARDDRRKLAKGSDAFG